MKKLIGVFILLCWVVVVQGQQTFVPNCAGIDDTSKFVSIIATIGANTGTIRLPYKAGTRCAVNAVTIPDNITLDNSDGTGIKANAGQAVTVLGPVVNPVSKPMFFGPGSFVFTGNTHIGTNGQALVSNGLGGTTYATISGGGGGGAVDSFNGRTGAVVPVTNDYTWAMIDKSLASIADIPFRSADLLTNGTTGTGQIVLRDSPTLITPVLGAATATSINGIGISGTAGKTLTITNSVTLTATSDGFTGVIPTGGTFAMGASTLSVSSTTDVTTANHSHAITTSSSPGAAASILASNASGHLQLTRLGIATAPTQPLEVNGNIFVSAATANLFLKDTSTGLQAATTGVITPQNNNAIRSTNYTAGLIGWNINAIGDAEFNSVDVRGTIRSSVFQVSEISATAGTFGVFFSAANLSASAVIPASGSFTFNANNSDAGGMLFAVNDVVRFKGLSTTGVSDTWATVTARTNNGNTTTYTATLNSGTASTTFVDGTAVVDYGPSGTGFITLSADGTIGASPNLTMATHAGSPWSTLTTRARLGNLKDSYGYGSTDIYGFGVGQYGTAGQSWLTVDPTNGVRIGNNTTVLTQVDGSGNAFFTGTITANQGGTIAGWTINSNRLNSGTTYLASSFDPPAGAMAWFGKSTTTLSGAILRDASNRQISMIAGNGSIYPHIDVFDGTHHRVTLGGLNAPFEADGSTDSMGMKIWDSAGNLLVQFHDLANTIAGLNITSTRASVGSGSTTAGLDSTITGGDDVRIFAGSSTASSAPFRVTEAGILTATNVAITAGSGNVTLDSTGLKLTSGTGGSNQIRWFESGVEAARIQTLTGSTRQHAAIINDQLTATGSEYVVAAYNSLGGAVQFQLRTSNNSVGSSWAVLGTTDFDGAGGSFSPPSGFGLAISSDASTITPPATSAILDLQGTTGAVLFPRLTTTQRDALTPTNGMVIYNSTTNKLQVRAAGAWVDLH